MSNLRKWADEHQYDAEPQPGATEDMGVMPSVHLLHMPDDPLGVLAAQNGIYKGHVKRNLTDVTDDERRQALDDMMKTTLQSPLESIKMHWVIEGVDRAFTHQMVRQRTANFGQESLRFSVVGDLIEATTLPPDLHGTERAFVPPDYSMLGVPDTLSFNELMGAQSFTWMSQDDRNRAVWDWCIHQIDQAYHYLATHGVAAEEARGLLPHCTATRLHWQTDLRALMKVMGERLCTQAQFHWRTVAALIQNAIRTYTPNFSWMIDGADVEMGDAPEILDRAKRHWEHYNRWQFELLADSGIFRPVCYQTGKCMFQASADRGCTIRERVEEFGAHGIPSDKWHVPVMVRPSNVREEGFAILDGTAPDYVIKPIDPSEWLLNPAAARKQS